MRELKRAEQLLPEIHKFYAGLQKPAARLVLILSTHGYKWDETQLKRKAIVILLAILVSRMRYRLEQ